MRCDGCEHSMIEVDPVGGDKEIVVFCEHEKFILPERVIDGLEIYLNELPDNWQPDMCPLKEVGNDNTRED